MIPQELEDLSSSQDSNLGDDQLDQLVSESKPGNTKHATNWGWSKFTKWMQRRDIDIDMKTVSEERLNETLRKFYAEVKTEKKAPLTPSALTGIWAAIQRALRSAPYNRSINIIGDRAFTLANEMFKARCRLYYKANNRKPQHKSAIEKTDKILLNSYFGDPSQDPVKLQEYVWFSICLQFGRRGREGWRAMKKGHFVAGTDSDGKRFITTMSTESTKNIQGGNKQSDQDYSDTRMYEVEGSRMCPVQAFELYSSKLHPENLFLFQKAKKNFSLDSLTWYTKEILGKNTIGDMMKNISKKAGLGKTYTNHCVRATTVTSLYQNGVDAQTICSITKHKNEGTLKHYISSRSDQQKQHTSRLLSAAMMGDSTCEDPETAKQTVCHSSQVVRLNENSTASVRHSSQVEVAHYSGGSSNSNQLTMSNSNAATGTNGMAHLSNIFSNATFNDCVINLHGFTASNN